MTKQKSNLKLIFILSCLYIFTVRGLSHSEVNCLEFKRMKTLARYTKQNTNLYIFSGYFLSDIS
jgi:hypothetical protein